MKRNFTLVKLLFLTIALHPDAVKLPFWLLNSPKQIVSCTTEAPGALQEPVSPAFSEIEFTGRFGHFTAKNFRFPVLQSVGCDTLATFESMPNTEVTMFNAIVRFFVKKKFFGSKQAIPSEHVCDDTNKHPPKFTIL